MDVLIQKLMQTVLILTGIVSTVVVGGAFVADNSALAPVQPQAQQNVQQSAHMQGRTHVQAPPQSPTAPGVVQQRASDDDSGVQSTVLDATYVNVRDDGAPVAPQAVSR